MRNRFIALFLTALIVSSSVTSTVRAVSSDAFDETFFAGNNITWYDPRCPSKNEAKIVQLAGKDTVEKILNFFMRKGLSLAQASGIIGNMMQESGLNPAIIQGGGIADCSYTLQDGKGFGLVQWTSGGRQQNFMKFMKDMGVCVTDLSGQLEFVWKEMSESYPKTVNALKSTQDPVEAAVAVHGPPSPGYEASADSPDKVRSVRGGNAKKVYDQYSDAPALAGNTADPNMEPAGEGTDDTAVKAALQTPTKSGQKSGLCKDETIGGQGLAKTVAAYAWHQHRRAGSSEAITPTEAYANAITKALSDSPKRYVGGTRYKGIDCGGFVTLAMYDSGYEKKYNTNGTGGNTISQERWLSGNWKKIGASEPRLMGDVAINGDHTYMWVDKAKIASDFQTNIASASWDERAPMAGMEGEHDDDFNWYRKA